MTPLEFMYWLKGYFDITRTSKLDPPNVDIIKKQMDEVFSQNKPAAFIPTVWTDSNLFPRGT